MNPDAGASGPGQGISSARSLSGSRDTTVDSRECMGVIEEADGLLRVGL